MNRRAGLLRLHASGPVGVLAAAIAVVLLSGVLAAAAVDSGGSALPVEGRVGAAGLVQEAVAEDAPVSQAPVPLTSTVAPPPTVTTAAVPSTTLPLTTPGSVRPPAPAVATTVAPSQGAAAATTTIPATTSRTWTATGHSSVRARMRMEPATPVAGQPVRFFVDDVSTPDPCCVVGLFFGDGKHTTIGFPTCGGPTSLTGLRATHTYDAPGAYEVYLLVVSGPPCKPPVAPEVPGQAFGGEIRACIAVGPGAADAPQCKPWPS
jgi:hypothetical protein